MEISVDLRRLRVCLFVWHGLLGWQHKEVSDEV